MTTRRFEPIDSGITPRFAGHSTFMRLPVTTNRPGPRHGPRQVREMSSLIKRVHSVTKISPYEICRVADLGDAPVNPIDLNRSLEDIQKFFSQIVEARAVPLAIGGDHLCSLPILRA